MSAKSQARIPREVKEEEEECSVSSVCDLGGQETDESGSDTDSNRCKARNECGYTARL